jgi:hypothetical protein
VRVIIVQGRAGVSLHSEGRWWIVGNSYLNGIMEGLPVIRQEKYFIGHKLWLD